MIAPGYIAHYDLNHTMPVFVLFSQQALRLTASFVRASYTPQNAPYLSSEAEYSIFIESLSFARIKLRAIPGCHSPDYLIAQATPYQITIPGDDH